MLQVGLQITKNKDKYLRLLDHLNKCVDDISNINFINISSQDNIINYIDNLDILFITTSSHKLNDLQKIKEPQAGSLFQTKLDIGGYKTNKFIQIN